MKPVLRPLLGLAVLAALLLVWSRTPPHEDVSQRAHGDAPSIVAPESPEADGSRDSRSRREASTRQGSARVAGRGSLEGTEIPGGFLVDADGNFVATNEAVILFEYFLSVKGERPDDEIVAAIRAEIVKRLDAPAEAQALAFLDRYLLYRERGVALGRTDAGDEDLRTRFERLRSLRREIFGDEIAKRLFGESEQESEIEIRQHEVANDPDLSAEEKRAAIDKLDAELPLAAREAREQTKAVIRLAEDEARLRADGGSDEDVRALRVERFGEEAADRLEDLDRQRADWNARYGDYRAERARILADRSLTDEGRQAALDRLVGERFDGNEAVRARALDGVEDQAAAD